MRAEPVALVTGASSGIGLATAKALARAGFHCYGLSRSLPEATAGITWIQGDVRSDASVSEVLARITRESGRIDVLVNNAGIGLIAASEESSPDQVRALFETNLFGLIRMTNAVLPIMRSQRRGRIIQISSVAGFVPTPFMSLYTASKHAVEGYSESLDHELREFGVRSLIVQPGFTRSSINANAPQPDAEVDAYRGRRLLFSRFVEENADRAGEPARVAARIVAVATATAPAVRTQSGPDARMLQFLRRCLPSRCFDRLLRFRFKLDSRPARVEST